MFLRRMLGICLISIFRIRTKELYILFYIHYIFFLEFTQIPNIKTTFNISIQMYLILMMY